MEASRLLYERKEAARQLSISVRSLDYIIAATADSSCKGLRVGIVL